MDLGTLYNPSNILQAPTNTCQTYKNSVPMIVRISSTYKSGKIPGLHVIVTPYVNFNYDFYIISIFEHIKLYTDP